MKFACFHLCSSLSLTFRSLTSLQLAGHRYSIKNNVDLSIIPDELKGILNGIMQMEEMLCSLASPCFIMWVSKGGQYKARGNVITFSQDVSTLCTVLPRLPKELDVLIVRKTDSQTTPFYKDFRVRKSKVYALLCYLQQHNPFYRDITI